MRGSLHSSMPSLAMRWIKTPVAYDTHGNRIMNNQAHRSPSTIKVRQQR
jgi:hypothetical protein